MTRPQIRPAPVRRSVIVKAGPQRAFAAFTGNIASWWPPSHTIGGSPQPQVVLEGRAGGRWYERSPEGAECEWGKVLVWDPPGRLVLAWQLNGLWKYDPTLITEVEITFTASVSGETRVDLEHRNLERFGEHATEVHDAVGSDGGWLGILKTYGDYVEAT
jgi:uncharacterized protein YndB with AHSA1/START domain